MNDQNHSETVTSEGADSESPLNDMSSIIESLYAGILDDLIDICILDVCFEVHREIKIGEPAKKMPAVESRCASVESRPAVVESRAPVVESRGRIQRITVPCYICNLKIDAEKFASHLSLCMGVGFKRRACQNISFKESVWDTDSSDSDAKPSSSKKRNRKGNKNRNKHSRSHGSSSDSSVNYKDMTQEEMVAFYNQHCGVISKRSKQPCKMTLNCSRHTENERIIVRNGLLSDLNEQRTANGSNETELSSTNQIDMNDQIPSNETVNYRDLIIDAMNDLIPDNEVIDVDGIDEDVGSGQITLPS